MKITIFEKPATVQGFNFGKGSFALSQNREITLASHGVVESGLLEVYWRDVLQAYGEHYWKKDYMNVGDSLPQKFRKMGLLKAFDMEIFVLPEIVRHVSVARKISFLRREHDAPDNDLFTKKQEDWYKKTYTADTLETPKEFIIADLGRLAEDAILSGATYRLRIEKGHPLFSKETIQGVISGYLPLPVEPTRWT